MLSFAQRAHEAAFTPGEDLKPLVNVLLAVAVALVIVGFVTATYWLAWVAAVTVFPPGLLEMTR